MMTTEGENLVRLVHRRKLVVGPLSFPWGMNLQEPNNTLVVVTREAHKAAKEGADE